MKKLIVLVTTLVMGVAVQAAALDWKYTSNNADAGSTVYVMWGEAVSSFTDITAITGNNISSGVLERSGRSTYATGTATIAGDKSSITDASFYFVVVNAANDGYWISGTQNGSSAIYNDGETGTAYDSVNPTAITYSTFSGGGGDPVTPPGPGGSEGIPEPTSGLLLIVGGSLLALRRKQK